MADITLFPARVTVYDYIHDKFVIVSETAVVQRPVFDDHDNDDDEDDSSEVNFPTPGILLTAVTFTIPQELDGKDLEQQLSFVNEGVSVSGSGLVNAYTIKDDRSPETWLDELARTWLGAWQIKDTKEGEAAEAASRPTDRESVDDWAQYKGEGRDVTFLLEALVDGDSVKWRHQKGGAMLKVRERKN
jgi:hypothetical protein